MVDTKDTVKTVQALADELLSLMGSAAKAQVSQDKDNDAVLVNLVTEEETGLLIGSRGDTLRAIQTILGMMVKNKTGEWTRVLVNIADWREKQEDKLTHLAQTTAERVKQTGESVPLYNLSPADRRVVHMVLSEDNEVETESVGEGQERHLVVHLKK